MGPTIACSSMGYLEESFFSQHGHSKPILYKQHIDDIDGSALCSIKELHLINFVTNFNPSIKYTYTISDNSHFHRLTIDNR